VASLDWSGAAGTHHYPLKPSKQGCGFYGLGTFMGVGIPPYFVDEIRQRCEDVLASDVDGIGLMRGSSRAGESKNFAGSTVRAV
jgi:hypothetical protein